MLVTAAVALSPALSGCVLDWSDEPARPDVRSSQGEGLVPGPDGAAPPRDGWWRPPGDHPRWPGDREARDLEPEALWPRDARWATDAPVPDVAPSPDAAPPPDAAVPDAPPPLRPRGALCSADAQCASAHCTDGVCCAVSCAAPCRACNLPGQRGICGPVPAGSFPPAGKSCPGVTPPSGCGRDGRCDGAGGCRLWSAGTVCKKPRCDKQKVELGGECNGHGSCVDLGKLDCSPYRCDPVATACYTSCASDAQCHGKAECEDGVCEQD